MYLCIILASHVNSLELDRGLLGSHLFPGGLGGTLTNVPFPVCVTVPVTGAGYGGCRAENGFIKVLALFNKTKYF